MNDQFAPRPLANRRRRAWLLAGTVLTVVALLVGIAAVGTSLWAAVSPLPLPGPLAQASTETEQHSHRRAAEQLDIDVENGDVSILAGGPNRVDISRTLRWSRVPPTIDETWSGDTLRIAIDCPSSSRNRVCEVDQVLQAPPSVAAAVQLAVGKIEVRGIDGALSLSTDVGAITVADVTGPLSARTSAGNVVGTGLRSPSAEVQVEAGAARLRFDAAPQRVSVEVSAGSVTIEVPPGDSYQVRVSTAVGAQQVEVVQDPDAQRLIEVSTAVGDVRIRYTS